ncbi:MAG TPA: phage tail spike protein, partial [Thermaerobacter sp.]
PILEDLHVEKLENAAITYEFAVPADHPDAQTIAPEGYVIIRDLDGLLQQLRIKTVEDELDSEGKRIRRVTCENAALELNGSIVRPQTWTGVTASQALTNALTGTRWQPGIVEWSGTRTITIDGYKTVTEVLHQIASEFDAEIRWHVVWQDGRIVGRFVDLLRQRGRYTGKRFEYAKDITGLRRIEDTTELVTAMIGVGKADENGNRLTFTNVVWSKANGDPADKPQGQDWVGDEDALQRWGLPGGRHIFGIYDDPDEEDANKLLQKTWNALQQRVNSRYTYEVDVVLLERLAEQVEPAREPEYYSLQAQFYAQFEGQPIPGPTGWEHEAVRLGDTVTIHDTSVDPPLVLEARVIEIQRSYVDPARDKVVLGYYRPLLTSLPDVVADLQRRLNQRQGVWDSKEAPIVKSPTPPDNPTDGMLWLNTAQVPNVLYRYDGTLAQWVKATPTEASEVGAEIAVTKGTTPPSNPQVGQLWLDTSTAPNAWRRWDGTQWVKATPTTASEVGAETPAGAQQKADQAEQNAKNAV